MYAFLINLLTTFLYFQPCDQAHKTQTPESTTLEYRVDSGRMWVRNLDDPDCGTPSRQFARSFIAESDQPFRRAIFNTFSLNEVEQLKDVHLYFNIFFSSDLKPVATTLDFNYPEDAELFTPAKLTRLCNEIKKYAQIELPPDISVPSGEYYSCAGWLSFRKFLRSTTQINDSLILEHYSQRNRRDELLSVTLHNVLNPDYKTSNKISGVSLADPNSLKRALRESFSDKKFLKIGNREIMIKMIFDQELKPLTVSFELLDANTSNKTYITMEEWALFAGNIMKYVRFKLPARTSIKPNEYYIYTNPDQLLQKLQ